MTLTTAILLAWLRAVAQVHGLDPDFVQAVAIVESRASNGPELSIRVGRLGRSKYFGPLG